MFVFYDIFDIYFFRLNVGNRNSGKEIYVMGRERKI